MAVDRLSVTVPAELGAALRALAEARGETVSTLVAGALERELRGAALDQALADADEQFGPLPDELIESAEEELRAIAAAGKKRRRR